MSAPFAFPSFSLGCWGFAGGRHWGDRDERGSIATIHAALDHGWTLLDTAPGYGDGLSEEIVGRALRGRRDRALIATKVSDTDFSAEGVRASCERSLRRLQTDRIDLLQIHWLGEPARLEEVIAAFEALRTAGKVRACGVCNFGPESLARLRAAGSGWVTNQLPYNLLWRAIEFEIVPLCRRDGLGVLAYSPLQQALLTGRYRTADEVPEGRARTRHFRGTRPMARHGGPGCEAETFATLDALRVIAGRLGRPMAQVALAWLRHQPAVASVLVGATTPAQVEENDDAAGLVLDDATLHELDAVTRDLKLKLGPDPDPWAATSRYR